jgi:hypothetical protein
MGKTYWERKMNQTYGMMDWATTVAAMLETTRSRQYWLSKHSSGFCGVGKMMYRMKKWSAPTCPRCKNEEDVEHVWICHHSEAQQMWDMAMHDIADWLRIQGTQPEITTAIINGLNAWRNNSHIEYDEYDKEVSMAAKLQHQTGWKNFFEGWPNMHWVKLQSHYFVVALRSQQTGKRWMIELIKKLWGVAWDLWEHRNGILHKKDVQVQNVILSQEIHQLWEHQKRIHLDYKKGQPTLLTQLLQWPIVKQEHWRNIIELRIQRKESNKASPSFAAEREGLRQFLSGYTRSTTKNG